MRLLSVDPTPRLEIEGWAASSGGGRHRVRVPLLCGAVEGLPAGLDGLLATADLQARAPGPAPARLLGELLAETCRDLPGLDPARVGVLLAGDLYAAPDAAVRGATGDVGPVWRAFSAAFRWVVGVPGNHDLLGPEAGLLDGGTTERDGLRIGGLGGVLGRPRRDRPWRRELPEMARALAGLEPARLDLLLVHQAPRLPAKHYPGSEAMASLLAPLGPLLVVCGHSHWRAALGELGGGLQVLNVDSRAVLLTRPGAPGPGASQRPPPRL